MYDSSFSHGIKYGNRFHKRHLNKIVYLINTAIQSLVRHIISSKVY